MPYTRKRFGKPNGKCVKKLIVTFGHMNPNDFTLFNNLQLGTKECLEKHCCFLIESKIVDDDDVGSIKVYEMKYLLWLAGFFS